MELINIADVKNPKTGKTYREENNEKQHKYKVDDLVEIQDWGHSCEYGGMRLYIIGCVRDCDGTPLYVLGTKGMELYEKVFAKNDACYNFGAISGISEDNIKLIKTNL